MTAKCGVDISPRGLERILVVGRKAEDQAETCRLFARVAPGLRQLDLALRSHKKERFMALAVLIRTGLERRDEEKSEDGFPPFRMDLRFSSDRVAQHDQVPARERKDRWRRSKTRPIEKGRAEVIRCQRSQAGRGGKGGNMSPEKNNTPWFEVSVEGLRKTLERKGKIAAIYELVQNSWDEDAKDVKVQLTEPKNGVSQLTCVDNAKGYADIHTAHTMFTESYKKSDPEKRGRFQVGEKFVVALCDEATIRSTTGAVIFHKNKTRSFDAKDRTKGGSEFEGQIAMTPAEWKQITQQVHMLIPPPGSKTAFNGTEIAARRPLKTFSFTLPTEIADSNGVMRLRQCPRGRPE
jgi:Histidine kinase-, DNA gyrase B-, and HSP90-like ATPase